MSQNENFQKGILKFQSRNNLSLKDLANKLNKSVSVIGSWRQGVATTSYNVLTQLIEYGMTAQELFGDELANKLILNSLDTAHVIQFVNSQNFQQNEFENGANIIHELASHLKRYENYLDPKALDYKLKMIDDQENRDLHIKLWNKAKAEKEHFENEVLNLKSEMEKKQESDKDKTEKLNSLYQIIKEIQKEISELKKQKQ